MVVTGVVENVEVDHSEAEGFTSNLSVQVENGQKEEEEEEEEILSPIKQEELRQIAAKLYWVKEAVQPGDVLDCKSRKERPIVRQM